MYFVFSVDTLHEKASSIQYMSEAGSRCLGNNYEFL